MRSKVLPVNENDKYIWELVTDVPKVSKEAAVVFIILNFFVPGLGTMFVACSSTGPLSKT